MTPITGGPKRPFCPSARPEWRGAEVFGVVGGTVAEPRVAFLERTLPPSSELLALCSPAPPTEVFRFAAACACQACAHFKEDRCHLVEKVVQELPPVVDELPPCLIRDVCRWFSQEGGAACLRCPQIVTDSPPLDDRMVRVTDVLR